MKILRRLIFCQLDDIGYMCVLRHFLNILQVYVALEFCCSLVVKVLMNHLKPFVVLVLFYVLPV